jgi:hypothetical protein
MVAAKSDLSGYPYCYPCSVAGFKRSATVNGGQQARFSATRNDRFENSDTPPSVEEDKPNG